MFYLFHSCCFSTRRFSFTWCGHFSLCVTWKIFIAASGTACAQRKLLLQYTNFFLSYLLPLPLPRLCCCSLCCARRAPPPTQRSWENNKKSTRRARRPYATILWKRMSVNSYRYFDVNGKCRERGNARERTISIPNCARLSITYVLCLGTVQWTCSQMNRFMIRGQ